MECPLGYKSVNHNELRDSVNVSCGICPAGTYGNHTERFDCATCLDGYYCPAGRWGLLCLIYMHEVILSFHWLTSYVTVSMCHAAYSLLVLMVTTQRFDCAMCLDSYYCPAGSYRRGLLCLINIHKVILSFHWVIWSMSSSKRGFIPLS